MTLYIDHKGDQHDSNQSQRNLTAKISRDLEAIPKDTQCVITITQRFFEGDDKFYPSYYEFDYDTKAYIEGAGYSEELPHEKLDYYFPQINWDNEENEC